MPIGSSSPWSSMIPTWWPGSARPKEPGFVTPSAWFAMTMFVSACP